MKSHLLHFDIGGFFAECHEVESKGDKVLYRRACGAYMWEPEVELVPAQTAWNNFWTVVEALEVWRWEKYYSSDILDGVQWELKLRHGKRKVTSGGSNAYPGYPDIDYPAAGEFGRFIQALRELTGKPEIH